MATKKKKQPMKRSRKAAILAFLVLVFAMCVVIGYAAINACTIYVRRAEVYVPDLPPAFEGKSILYVSDIDLCGLNTSRRAADAVMRLQGLNPDILLLGGDYNSRSLLKVLNSASAVESDPEAVKNRTSFFHYISSFFAPLGKFGIASPDDFDHTGLKALMTESGIQPINDRTAIQLGSDTIWIVGISANDFSMNSTASTFHRGDCVICCAYSPICFPQMMISEAGDGGAWVDIALAGHTHGGQIRLLGRNVISLNSQEMQYLYGWTRDTGIPMLTTSGLGCEGSNLRLGSHGEVWLITLTGQQRVELPDLQG